MFGNPNVKQKINDKKRDEYNYTKLNIDKEKWFKEKKEIDYNQV